MLLAQKSYVEGALALLLYCAKLVDDQHTGNPADKADVELLEVLTPIATSWPSQWCLEANNPAIQAHGRYGYTTEFDVEQYYRDNRLNASHEGTHGIQGLDLLGRKVRLRDGAGLTLLVNRIRRTADVASEAQALCEYAAQLETAVDRLVEVTETLWGAEDIATTLANSSVYLGSTGHVVVAWIWLEQLLAVGDRQGDFHDGKRAAAWYFFRYESPKLAPQFDLLASLDRTTIDAQPAWF